MSGLAKLLVKAGVIVSASDITKSEITDELKKKGIDVKIGHAKKNIPADAELVIYSSACPDTNLERVEARARQLRQINNFQFLGEMTEDRHTVLVCGTHGKSTTTALVGSMLIEGGLNPTVIVGTRVPGFKDRNAYLGGEEIFVIEGDEYAKHFLAFHPTAVILNNIELDHTDVFPDIESLMQTFQELLTHVQPKGIVIANANDPHIQTLIGQERSRLEARGITIKTFGFGSHADIQIADVTNKPGAQLFAVRDDQGLVSRFTLQLPGRMNVMNATGALTLALQLGVSGDAIRRVLESFEGVWRRFERIADYHNMLVISDYAHHPTAIAATLEAAKQFYPGRRIVLCFQPHHRHRTKHLFLDFVPSFDKADVLILTEIYDVAGRDDSQDQDISSRDLEQAIMHHDADRGVKRLVEYAANPEEALQTLRRLRVAGDVILVMGAGDIYLIANKVLE